MARQGLSDALSRLGAGMCVLVVWKLDRLGRSVAQLIHLIDGIGRAGVAALLGVDVATLRRALSR